MAVALYQVESRFRPFAAMISLPRAENDLGTMLMRLGQLDRAEECLTSSLEHFAEAGEDPARGQALLSLAELRGMQRRSAEARDRLAEAVALGERLGDVQTLAEALQQLAELHEADRDHAAADAAFGRALAILEEAGLAEWLETCRQAHRRMRAERTAGDAPHAQSV